MHILHIISSPRRADSYSIQLGDGIIDKLQAAHLDSTLHVRDLATKPFPHLEEAKLAALHTPSDQRTPDQHAAAKHSDEAIAEVMAADIIVIGAPLYNFSIPSTLKAWIDHIARAGITFRYSAVGPEGLVKGKQVYVAMSSGGVYSTGPWAHNDFVAPYLKAVLGFLGMTDVTVIRVEGVAVPELKEGALAKALASVSITVATEVPIH